MKMKKFLALMLALIMVLSLCACSNNGDDPKGTFEPTTVTDMIGREVTVTPGSYKRVVCVGAGALRMYHRTRKYAFLYGKGCRTPHSICSTRYHRGQTSGTFSSDLW